jgi:hypothetical protein
MQAIDLLVLTATAVAVITDERFVSTTGGVPSAGANTLGVAKSQAASGEKFPVVASGTAIVESGGALAAGAAIETDNQGRAVTKNTGVTVARLAPGETAAGAGEKVEVILIQN